MECHLWRYAMAKVDSFMWYVSIHSQLQPKIYVPWAKLSCDMGNLPVICLKSLFSKYFWSWSFKLHTLPHLACLNSCMMCLKNYLCVNATWAKIASFVAFCCIQLAVWYGQFLCLHAQIYMWYTRIHIIAFGGAYSGESDCLVLHENLALKDWGNRGPLEWSGPY